MGRCRPEILCRCGRQGISGHRSPRRRPASAATVRGGRALPLLPSFSLSAAPEFLLPVRRFHRFLPFSAALPASCRFPRFPLRFPSFAAPSLSFRPRSCFSLSHFSLRCPRCRLSLSVLLCRSSRFLPGFCDFRSRPFSSLSHLPASPLSFRRPSPSSGRLPSPFRRPVFRAGGIVSGCFLLVCILSRLPDGIARSPDAKQAQPARNPCAVQRLWERRLFGNG